MDEGLIESEVEAAIQMVASDARFESLRVVEIEVAIEGTSFLFEWTWISDVYSSTSGGSV